MEKQPDVLIVGGGIIGLTTAYELSQAGLTVEIREKSQPGRQASWAGAGIIPPGNPERAATPIDRLRAWSVCQFPRLTAELREITGIDNGFRLCGGLEFLHPEDLELPARWRAEGIAFEPVRSGEVAQLESELSPPNQPAYHFPGMGQVRNPWHLRALIVACERLGVRIRGDVPVDARELTSDSYRHVVIAAGAWSGQLLREILPPLTIRPVRGQIVLFHPATPVLRRVLIDGKRYLVPRDDGRVLVGSTEEPEAGFELGNTAVAVDELIRFAIGLIPALASATVERTWSGLRPGSADGMPYLGRLPGLERVILASGHFRAGVQLSPGTARVVRSLITGETLPFPIEAFRPDREPDRSVRPAFRS